MSHLASADWQRRDQPVLSAMTSNQDWAQVQLLAPTVVAADGGYKMWYVANATRTRVSDNKVGLAESDDGINWDPHPDNPILDEDDLPWRGGWVTPYVVYDREESLYKMWFEGDQKVWEDERVPLYERDVENVVDRINGIGYATSENGRDWDVRQDPVYPRGHGPCVLKEGPNDYHMWLDTPADPEDTVDHQTIYHLTSDDGIDWTRDPDPAVTPISPRRSVVYPCVVKDTDQYVMYYACHSEDSDYFEMCHSVSPDGHDWTHHQDESVFPATRNPNDFDCRYTSTPRILEEDDRYLLYYSARDCCNLYAAGNDTLKHDDQGVYQHIGVAECPKS